jgi:hypothetical protein
MIQQPPQMAQQQQQPQMVQQQPQMVFQPQPGYGQQPVQGGYTQ